MPTTSVGMAPKIVPLLFYWSLAIFGGCLKLSHRTGCPNCPMGVPLPVRYRWLSGPGFWRTVLPEKLKGSDTFSISLYKTIA